MQVKMGTKIKELRRRDGRKQEDLANAEKAISEQGDLTECVEMLRAATEEFPSEPKVFINLGSALVQHGWKTYGARSYRYSDCFENRYRQLCLHENITFY